MAIDWDGLDARFKEPMIEHPEQAEVPCEPKPVQPVRIDLARIWPMPARAEVDRIRAMAKSQGWSDSRLAELADDFLLPGEVVAVIGESIGISRRPGGPVHRWFSRQPPPMENQIR